MKYSGTVGSKSTIPASARKKFGQDVLAKRDRHTQEEFAKVCGISQGTLSKIEKGHLSITDLTLRKTAEKLELEIELEAVSRDPPSKHGFCENPDCASVGIHQSGNELLFIPRIFRFEDVKGKCPLGHPLITRCKHERCNEPINPGFGHVCSNTECKHPLFDSEVIINSLICSGILADWEELEETRARSHASRISQELRIKTRDILERIEKENARRSNVLSQFIMP